MFCIESNCQDILEWEKVHEFSIPDFQASTTKIDGGYIYSLHSGISMEFTYSTSPAEFMFKKNFNSGARCIFNPLAAAIIDPDSSTAISLVHFAHFEFDLTELYTRKFRKRLFEEKSGLSSADFFQPIFNEIQSELNIRNTEASNKTYLGRKDDILVELHQEVIRELELYTDYCFSYKPPKKQKRKNKE